jgi:hypothetical protein
LNLTGALYNFLAFLGPWEQKWAKIWNFSD